MASPSGEVDGRITDFDFDAENGTPRELLSFLKFSFSDSDFAKVESVLMEREAKLKLEIEITQQANEWLKERLEFEGMEKVRAIEKLNKWEKECFELQQLNSQFSQEKNIIYEEQRKAESEAELWKNKYQQLESRILKLEADAGLLLNVNSVEPNVRASDEHGKDAGSENGRANGDRARDGSEGPSSRSIVEITDSDDDCAPGEILSHNEMTSLRFSDSAHSGQTSMTGMVKRKLDSCLNVSESKTYNNGDEVENFPTAEYKTEKLQKLIHEPDGSPLRQSPPVALSPRSNNKEKFCSTSSQEPAVLRQCEVKMGQEHTSQDLRRRFHLDLPAAYDIEHSSSLSSSSSDSDDDMEINFDISKLFRTLINDKKWESEADMLAAFEKDNELYLQAVCALHRQQTSVGKLPRSFSSANNRGFSPFSALRGTALADFLVDGDPQGKLRKSVSELQQYDKKGLDDCKKLAIEHSKQLFEIYQRKEDPLFLSQIGCSTLL